MDLLAYPIGTRVRLTATFGDTPCGSEGVVFGYYRRDPPAYAVAVAGMSLAVPPAQLEAVDAEES